MKVLRALAAWGAMALTACAVPPRDPFARANWALQRGDLGGALIAYDSVPVAHARYPEARAGAMTVERSMRRCHELLLEALLMRSEWRDRDALATFERAHALWPKLPGIDGWIEATRQRLRSLPAAPAAPPEPLVAVEPTPVPWIAIAPSRPVPMLPEQRGGSLGEPSARPIEEPAAAPLADTRPEPATTSPSAEVVPPGEVASASAAAASSPNAPIAVPAEGPASSASAVESPSPPLSAATNDPVALGLVDVESKLRSGQLQVAVSSLIGLSDRFPADVRVRVRLARLLQQRALVRYGEGSVQEAIGDWQRVLELEPQNEGVRRMLAAASRETIRAQ